MAETYAIVETGGKQYRAEKGAELVVDRLDAKEGEKVTLRPVMFRGEEVVVGSDLEKVKVEAKVAEHFRGEKLRVFRYKPKKGYRRRLGHRSELTRLEVTEVKLLSRKPPKKAADADGEEKAEAKGKAKGVKAESGKGKSEAKGKAAAKGKSETKGKAEAKKAGDGAEAKGAAAKEDS